VVRFQRINGGLYADRNGFLFPLQDNFTSMVPVIDGKIPLSCGNDFKGRPTSEKDKQWLDQILYMLNYMENSKVWSENISQITVDEKGDLIMVPRVGKEKFIFGKPDDIESKFRRLEDYYKCIVPEKGKDYYSTVSVKFHDQIVCRK